MSISNLSSTQSPSVGGFTVPEHTHRKKEFDESMAAAVAAATGSSTTAANPLASAIATALTQLGLTFTPGSSAAADNADAANTTPSAPLPQPLKGSQQVQQYKDIAATFSNLAQALSSNSSSTSSTSNGTSGLTTVFQELWASLSASSGSSSSTVPNFSSFLQTLARNFSESGISDLRGVFVDTVV